MRDTLHICEGVSIGFAEDADDDSRIVLSASVQADVSLVSCDGAEHPQDGITIDTYLTPSEARGAAAYLLALSAMAEGGGPKIKPSLDEVLQRLTRAGGGTLSLLLKETDGGIEVTDMAAPMGEQATGNGSTVLAAVEELVTWRQLELRQRRDDIDRQLAELTEIADALDDTVAGTGVMDDDDDAASDASEAN